MYIKASQFSALARYIVRQLQKNNWVTVKSGEESLTAAVAAVFQKNQEEENKLHDDARALLEKNKQQLGLQIDEEKALGMIKKQLAKQRNFVL